MPELLYRVVRLFHLDHLDCMPNHQRFEWLREHIIQMSLSSKLRLVHLGG